MTEPRLLLGPAFGEFGGVSQHVRNLHRWIRTPHDMFRIPPWSAYHPLWYGVSWKWVARRTAAPDPYALWMARRARNYGAVHLHDYASWFPAYIERTAPRARRIYTVHQIFFEEDFSPQEWPRWRAIRDSMYESLRRVDRVVAVARWHLPLLEKQGIKATWIPNGADVDQLAARADAQRFRAAHGQQPFYLWAAAFLQYKRPQLFLRLAEALPERGFVMIGRGVTRAAVRQALGRDPPPNLRILGQRPRQEVLDAMAAARAYVLPSTRETFSIAVLEALALARPVVAAQGTGASDILEDGRTGFLFRPDDFEDLRRAADRAWERPDVGAAGRRLVEREYTWKAVASRLDDLYADVLGSRPA